MEKRSRRGFTKEFKAETVALIRHSGKSIAEICRDMGLAESSVHRWLAQPRRWLRQLSGLGTREARRPRWGAVSRTNGRVVCLAAWHSTTVAEHLSVIQGAA